MSRSAYQQKLLALFRLGRWVIIAAALLLFLLLVSGNPDDNLRVQNDFPFPIEVYYLFQDDKNEPVVEKVGKVPAHRMVNFWYAVARREDLHLLFSDLNGKVVREIRQPYNSPNVESGGWHERSDTWNIAVKPEPMEVC